MSNTDLYKRPTLTYLLIGVCAAAFFVEMLYSLGSGALDAFLSSYGFSAQNLLSGRFWTLITSVFLHANVEHLLLNMLALFFFGRVIEMNLGRKKFSLIFIASAITGNLAFLTFSFVVGSLGTSVIGASAAIFGLMGTAMLVKPLEFVFYPFLIPVPVILVAVLYTLSTIGSFILTATNLESSNISYISHIGGLIAGMLFGFKEEKSMKGLVILLFLLLILLLAPFVWTFLGYLENFDYISALSGLFR